MKLDHLLCIVAAAALYPLAASAHFEVASGPGFAGTSQEITFSVGHGCTGVDTSSVRIEIPAGVGSVRAEDNSFGRAHVERNEAGDVTAVTWQKPDEALLASDDNYYKLTVRLKVPNQPFTTLRFLAHQICKTPDGTTTQVDWIADDESGADEPAPALTILPPRSPGWNQYTVPVDLPNLATWFGDAAIVWKDHAAYSANAKVADQIKNTDGVTTLDALKANDVVWVKY